MERSVSMEYTAKLQWDSEAAVWVAASDDITGAYFPVDGKIKSRHTANGIMKQSGIDYRF